MRILSLTAGAAGMYCGSCLRDNALAVELLARGHEVTLMPVYTPTLVDEANVSRPQVLFSGLSVYLQQSSAIFRRLPRFLDRVWDSPRVIRAVASRASSATDARRLGELTIAMLDGSSGILKKEFDKLVDWVRAEPPPDVVNLPNSLLIAMAGPLRGAINRPICCTLQGEELFLDGLEGSYRERALALIRRHTPSVDRFIAVSDYCAGFMAGLLDVPRSRIDVVPLGISMAGYERPAPRGPNAPFTVGYFARVAPEKGLRELAHAYVRFRRRVGSGRVRLEAAGYMAPYQTGYLEEVRGVLAAAGLAGEFTYRGAVDRAGKLAFLRDIDVLSVPATYDEPKGMFLLEAMAAGVPVVQPRRGAFTEVVEKTGGGLLVQPDDVESVAEGLWSLWSDRGRLQTLAAQAFDGVRAHYTIEHSATRLLDIYGGLVAGAAQSSVA